MISHGKIEIIHGCMFAGKTTELIRRYNKYKLLNKNVLVINNKKDTRSGENSLCTHIGEKIKCLSLDKFNTILDSEIYKLADIIMIEEAQFFGNDLIDFVLCASEKDSKTVVVAGLLFDCYREKFGFIIDLIPYADNVTHLKAICLECSKLGFENTAIFTKRLVDNKSQTLVGGSDKYIVVCRNHYLQTTPVLINVLMLNQVKMI